ISPEAARVSALMESLETFSAEHIEAAIVRGSYRGLRAKGRNVVDVRRLPRALSPHPPTRKDGRMRGARSDRGGRGRLDLDATWRWIEGFDLTAGSPILVPLETVTLDTTFTRPPTFDISSNGLASGNVLVEAIVHG